MDSLQGVPVLRVRLIRKLAARLNGIDVSRVKVGDVIELPDIQAIMLVKEGWAAVEVATDTDAAEPSSDDDSEILSA
jgi:hypothetical protein